MSAPAAATVVAAVAAASVAAVAEVDIAEVAAVAAALAEVCVLAVRREMVVSAFISAASFCYALHACTQCRTLSCKLPARSLPGPTWRVCAGLPAARARGHLLLLHAWCVYAA